MKLNIEHSGTFDCYSVTFEEEDPITMYNPAGELDDHRHFVLAEPYAGKGSCRIETIGLSHKEPVNAAADDESAAAFFLFITTICK